MIQEKDLQKKDGANSNSLKRLFVKKQEHVLGSIRAGGKE
jgi:hypothetical protein